MSDKRTELENAATDIVQRAGLHHLSFRTLAERVGVKSSSVHYYFPEKADLAATLIRKYTEEFAGQLEDIAVNKPGLRNKLTAFIAIFERVNKANQFCLCGMMAAEVATLNDDNRRLLSQYFQSAEHWLQATLEAHPKELASSLKPRLLARAIMSGLEGALLIDRVDGTKLRLRAQRELIQSILT